MATYLDFLKALIALGPKFPQLLIIIQEIVEKVREAVSLITGQPMTFGAESPAQVSAEEIDKERILANMRLQGGTEAAGAIGDFPTMLRNLWAFIQAHPELMTLILSLFKK